MEGIMQDQNERIANINRYYEIYEGKQEWKVEDGNLDYKPTIKVTNYIKKLIDKKARFMLGREPYFRVVPIDGESSEEQADEKEKYLASVLESNKFHSKILKARKDCSIGGKVAIKLWADENGIKIIFTPAQEFIEIRDIDDVDNLQKIVFFYFLNNAKDKEDQRIRKQSWEIENERCILNQAVYNGDGELVEAEYTNFYNGLDFIPVIVIQNGGLTGETEGKSDIELLWSNQDHYNKLTSDDIDSLKFQMFGQTVFTDASADTLENIIAAPGAIIDLQTDLTQTNQGRQAQIERLENKFSYADKFKDTVSRIKSDMYDLMDMPDTSMEQLKGTITSGKAMKTLYWDLIAVCDEEWTEWRPALEEMAQYIFKMAEIYNLGDVPNAEVGIKVETAYPISEEELENEKKKIDTNEVLAGVRSKRSYIDKWSEVQDIESELESIMKEKGEEENLTYRGAF